MVVPCAPPPFNPFADVAVGNPWMSNEPDVPTVNSAAYTGLLGLIRQLDVTPGLAALVLGAAGGGKTHLIKRLISAHDVEAVFVYVHPLKDHNRIFTSLMEQVAGNLAARPLWFTGHRDVSQLDLLVGNVIAAGFEHYLSENPDDPGKIYLPTVRKSPLKILSFAKSPKWPDLVQSAYELLQRKSAFRSPMSKKILKAVLQYADASRREAVESLLAGTIPDEEECESLGLKFGDGDWSIEAQEQRSKQILKTIAGLLEFYRPMVLCFDQLDSVESPELVRAMGTLFTDIVNEAEHILPVGFARPENWQERFQKILDPAAAQRMTSNVFSLKGCNLEEALGIVSQRLEWAYDGVLPCPSDPFLPLDRASLQTGLQGVTSPREVITVANKLFLKTSIAFVQDPLEVVRDSLKAERERILASADQELPRQDTLVAALRLWLENQEKTAGYRFVLVDCVGGNLKVRVLPADPREKPRMATVRVETAAHWRPLTKTFDTLGESLRNKDSDVAVVIRDSRMRIPPQKGRMPKTVERLRAFEREGGRILYMDYVSLAHLYALVYTDDKISAGDLAYVAHPRGERKEIEPDALLRYVRDEFRSEILEQLSTSLVDTEIRKKRAKPVSGV